MIFSPLAMTGFLDKYVDVNLNWGMPSVSDLPFSTTLLVRDTCLCLHVQRAARALARRYDEALRPIGLTSGQFSLLMSLNRPEPPGMAQVAALLAMDRTTLTANLKPLERREFVVVRPGEGDKRRRVLALTSAGRTLLAAAMPMWEQTHRSIEGLLENSRLGTSNLGTSNLGRSGADRLRSDLQALCR
jgi:DNA-binding MarR family transcriptional regulator